MGYEKNTKHRSAEIKAWVKYKKSGRSLAAFKKYMVKQRICKNVNREVKKLLEKDLL